MRKLMLFTVLLAALAVTAANAESYAVKGISYCEGCQNGNVALNLESEGATVVLSARALQLNTKNGRHEGPGTIEALSVAADGSTSVIVRDLVANVSIQFADAPGSDGCSGKAIASLHVDGVAEGPGNRFSLDGSAVVGPGLCPESRVSAVLDIDRGQGFIKKSWGSIKVGTK